MSRPRDFLGPYRLVRLIRVGHTCRGLGGGQDRRHDALRPEGAAAATCARTEEEIAALKNEFECGKIAQAPEHHPHLRLQHRRRSDLRRDGALRAQEPEALAARAGRRRVAHLALKIIEQGAEALFYMHSEGWVHRDVKPDNFLVSDEGDVKLIDFAISQRAEERPVGHVLVRQESVQGTRSYMSPEQIRNQNLDAAGRPLQLRLRAVRVALRQAAVHRHRLPTSCSTST